MTRPAISDYHSFYEGYIQLVESDDVIGALQQSLPQLNTWLNNIPPSKTQYKYAPNKWTLAQVLQHIIDTERIFCYRALCIGRGEKQPLPGFEENEYAGAAPASHRTLQSLADEIIMLRQLSIQLFEDLAVYGHLTMSGTASGHTITVNAIGFIMVGHIRHHMCILEGRYLNK